MKVSVHIRTYDLAAGIKPTLKSTLPPLCSYGKKVYLVGDYSKYLN